MTELPTYNGMPPLTPRKQETMSGLQKMKTERDVAQVEYERLSHVGGEEFYAAGCVYRSANQVYMEAFRQSYATPPTPTISQMEDRHELQVFADKAERVVDQVLAFFLTVLAVVFVGGLMYKTFVWGY
jgi:hypothetical protein